MGATFLTVGALLTGWVVVRSSTTDGKTASTSASTTDGLYLGVAVLCLCIAWLPSLQHYISTAITTTDDKLRMVCIVREDVWGAGLGRGRGY